MSKLRITVTVDPEIEDWLRAGSKSSGRSLSELVRVCLREFSQENPRRFSPDAHSPSEDAWRLTKQDERET